MKIAFATLACLLAVPVRSMVPSIPSPPPMEDGITVGYTLTETAPPKLLPQNMSYAKGRVVVSDTQEEIKLLRSQAKNAEELLQVLNRNSIEFAKKIGRPYENKRDGETLIDGKSFDQWNDKLTRTKNDFELRAVEAEKKPRQFHVAAILEKLPPVNGAPAARVLSFDIPADFGYLLPALNNFDFTAAKKMKRHESSAVSDQKLLIKKSGAIIAVGIMGHDVLVAPLSDLHRLGDPDRPSPFNVPALTP
jgi:hypothetical protein